MAMFYALGIDPSKENFTTSLLSGGGSTIWKNKQWPTNREGFDACLSELNLVLRAKDSLVVGIEATASLDDNLLKWFSTLKAPFYVTPIRLNPAATARFTGHKPIRGKTDGMDANRRIGEFTLYYADRLSAYEHDGQAQAMARVTSERSRMVEEATAVKNRLADHLIIAFPEFTNVFKKPWIKSARAVLRKTPTARHAAKKRPKAFAKLKLSCRETLGEQRAKQLIYLASRSVASATKDSDAEMILFGLDQLDMLEKRIDSIEKQMRDYAQRSIDEDKAEPQAPQGAPRIGEQIRLIKTMRGAGVVGAAGIVLPSRGIARFASAKAFSAQLGACPEFDQTGTSKAKTRLTRSGDRRTRPMLYLLAQMACVHDPSFAFHKWRLMRKGLKPKQAVCACMNRLAKIMWTLVHTRSPYDVNRQLGQIAIHHGDLWKTFVKENSENKQMWKNIDEKWKNHA